MSLPSTRTEGAPCTVHVDGDPAAWIAAHRDELHETVLRLGAVLLRGFRLRGPGDPARARAALGVPPAALTEGFTSRQDLGDHVYTPSDWEPDREMCVHHEQSQGVDFPRLLVLGCLRPADSGGATLLADTRTVARHLPADLLDRCRRTGWRLVRTFRPYLGLSWSDAFGTADQVEVQRYCAGRLIGWEWLPDGTLRTTQRRSALVRHPVTGDTCWFNQIAFFSQWSVDEAEREVLLASFGPEGLPFNTSYGDGTPIGVDEFAALLRACDTALVRVRWEPGDVLLVDNILTAHGREPYTGARDLAVAPGDPTALSRCAPTVDPGPADPRFV